MNHCGANIHIAALQKYWRPMSELPAVSITKLGHILRALEFQCMLGPSLLTIGEMYRWLFLFAKFCSYTPLSNTESSLYHDFWWELVKVHSKGGKQRTTTIQCTCTLCTMSFSPLQLAKRRSACHLAAGNHLAGFLHNITHKSRYRREVRNFL